MPGQTSPWKFGVWPLALALLLHAIPWWMMHRGGKGEGLRDRVVQFRQVRLQPRPSERRLADASLPPATVSADAVPAALPAAVPNVEPAPVFQASAPKPVSAEAPAPSPPNPDAAAAPTPAQDPGNGHPPGWVFDPESYVQAEDVDQPPQLVGEWVLNEAAVPVQTKDRPRSIRVVLQMWISAEGHVDIYQFLDAEPAVPWLEALLKDVDKSTLKPAQRDGKPVAASWMVEMNIDLANGL